MEDHFERLEQVYDEIFAKQYGLFRPHVRQVIYRYLVCGILHNGFARVKCKGCGVNVSPCPSEAVRLIHKRPEELMRPAKEEMDWYEKRGTERGVDFSACPKSDIA